MTCSFTSVTKSPQPLTHTFTFTLLAYYINYTLNTCSTSTSSFCSGSGLESFFGGLFFVFHQPSFLAPFLPRSYLTVCLCLYTDTPDPSHLNLASSRLTDHRHHRHHSHPTPRVGPASSGTSSAPAPNPATPLSPVWLARSPHRRQSSPRNEMDVESSAYLPRW
jgi:hypothetical protein